MKLTIAALLALMPLGATDRVGVVQHMNGNALRDSVDLLNATSPDGNHNGVPDEADIAKPDFRAAIEHQGDAATFNNVAGRWPVDVDDDQDLDLVVASSSGPSSSTLTIWRNHGGADFVYSTRTDWSARSAVTRFESTGMMDSARSRTRRPRRASALAGLNQDGTVNAADLSVLLSNWR